MSFETIRKEAKTYFQDVSPSHDWHHVRRVLGLSRHLAGAEDADTALVELAAVLHDIGRGRKDRGTIDDHALWGAGEAGAILDRNGYDPERIDAVQHCIRAHRYSNDVDPETPEARILSDADNLDALGAIGVARTFCYSGENGRILASPDLRPEDDDSDAGRTGLNHLVKKILNLRDRMYTSTAKTLAEQRHDVVLQFVKRLRKEIHYQ